jgi:hypothetical protein
MCVCVCANKCIYVSSFSFEGAATMQFVQIMIFSCPRQTFGARLYGPHSCAENKRLLPLQELKFRFPARPACSLVTIPISCGHQMTHARTHARTLTLLASLLQVPLTTQFYSCTSCNSALGERSHVAAAFGKSFLWTRGEE